MLWNRGNAIALNIGYGQNYVGCTLRKLNDGKIHNVVFLLNGTRLYAYLDGVLQPNYPISTTPLDPNLGQAPISFGHWFAGTFPGELYDLRLYDEAISMAEDIRFTTSTLWMFLLPDCLERQMPLASSKTFMLKAAMFKTLYMEAA